MLKQLVFGSLASLSIVSILLTASPSFAENSIPNKSQVIHSSSKPVSSSHSPSVASKPITPVAKNPRPNYSQSGSSISKSAMNSKSPTVQPSTEVNPNNKQPSNISPHITNQKP